jgi:(2Fe-2S) ferredoxin
LRVITSPIENDMSDDNPFYKHHVFFCMNVRDGTDCRPSCGKAGAEIAQKHAKKRIKEMDLNGPGKVRINQAGCLDRCEEGPAVVIYPEGTWYTYVDTSDIDEIIDRHLVKGEVVERLKI